MRPSLSPRPHSGFFSRDPHCPPHSGSFSHDPHCLRPFSHTFLFSFSRSRVTPLHRIVLLSLATLRYFFSRPQIILLPRFRAPVLGTTLTPRLSSYAYRRSLPCPTHSSSHIQLTKQCAYHTVLNGSPLTQFLAGHTRSRLTQFLKFHV